MEQITDQVCTTLKQIVEVEIPEVSRAVLKWRGVCYSKCLHAADTRNQTCLWQDDDEDETKTEEGYKLSACMARLRAFAKSVLFPACKPMRAHAVVSGPPREVERERAVERERERDRNETQQACFGSLRLLMRVCVWLPQVL